MCHSTPYDHLIDDFQRHFRATFPSLLGCRLLVALSGGADSVALLFLLCRSDLGLDLAAAHVHHGVRGAEADGDAAYCRGLCERLAVPYHLLELVPETAAPEGREAAWRRQRYRLLHDLAAREEMAAVATAHQRDDIAEGVLVQLLRGTGPRAMAGIGTRTPEGVIRPLLPWSRQVLIGWLEAQHIAWREDSSNRELRHLRNAVRHRVLPMLEEHSPRLREHLLHLAAALAEDEQHLNAELIRQASWIDPWHPQGGVPLATLRALAPPLRSRWLLSQAERAGLGKVTRRQLQQLGRLLDHGAPRAITLAGRWRLRAVQARLWLEPSELPQPYCFRFSANDLPQLPLPWDFRVLSGNADPALELWQWTVPEAVEISVRSPRPGDVVGELGGAGMPARSLSGLLAEALPRHLRRTWPVLHVDGTIAWIPGVWQHAATGRDGSVVVEVTRR